MEAINPVRVLLFWDSEIARDAYGPYFYWNNSEKLDIANEPNYYTCGTSKKNIEYRDIDPNLWNVRMTMKVPSYYESATMGEQPMVQNARYDYTHSGVFLDMGSGSPIDDIIKSCTVRFIDWNNSMTDIELGMKFVDKVQAVSAVRKFSVSVGREYQV
ncbi:hypothetical protein M9H77_31048 [Catharanthus roseus]|uniref:Uncharacterized protein n=1 Tax=Catharanthus roseus TaxID=4058 RepID=A0ACB9ZZD5_CATRO|nr:hypothetical protein M9H77_31048 [Catharanthus roseus]